MADVQLPSIATATPAAADTVAGVQGGAVKRFAVSGIGAHGSFSHSGTYAAGSLGAKAQGVISVKDAPYSATGDGTTDDTAAIVAAHAAAKAANGELVFPDGHYKTTSILDFSDTDGTGRIVNVRAQRAGFDRQGAHGATVEYYGTGFAFKFGSAWCPQIIDGLSFLSKAAGQSGVMAVGTRPQMRNGKIANFDGVGLQLGEGTSGPKQAYFGDFENLLVEYPSLPGADVLTFAGPLGDKGIWVCGGSPASNANALRNVVCLGGYGKRLVIDGNNNSFVHGDLTYITTLASSSIVEINGSGNEASGFYLEPGTGNTAPAKFFVFGAGSARNRIENPYCTAPVRPHLIDDAGFGNKVILNGNSGNFFTSTRSESGCNLAQNAQFLGSNGTPSVGASPYGWVNFSTTPFTRVTPGKGLASALEVTTTGAGSLSCTQYLSSTTAGRSKFNFFALDYFKGKQLTFGCFVKTSVAGLAGIRAGIEGVTGDVYSTSSSLHSGSGLWERLVVSIRVPDDGALTSIVIHLRVESGLGAGTAQFSEPTVVVGTELPHFSPPPVYSDDAIVNGRLSHAPFAAFTDADTTPDVSTANMFTVANSGATTITAFDNGRNGQVIYLLPSNANTTLANSAGIQTSTGANKALSLGVVYKLVHNGSKWYEF